MAIVDTPQDPQVEQEFARPPTSKSYRWILTGLFAALHFEVAMIPFSAAVGAGGFITLGLMTGPIIGLLLGPVYGALSVLLGSILLGLVNPASMVIGPFTPIATALGAACAGALVNGKYRFPISVYLVATVVFLVGPGALAGIAALWFHAIAMILCLLFLAPPFATRMTKGLESSTTSRGRIPAVWFALFVSTMVDQMIGLTAFVYYYHYVIMFDASIITSSLLMIATLYPIERLIASVIASAVAVPVLAAVRQAGLPLLSRT